MRENEDVPPVAVAHFRVRDLEQEVRQLRDGHAPGPAEGPREVVARANLLLVLGLAKLGAKLANFCKFLAGSFSAVSKRNFARKYTTAFFKLYKICILLYHCNLKFLAKNRFEKSAIFVKNQQFL